MKYLKWTLLVTSIIILSGCFSLRLEERKHSKGYYLSVHNKLNPKENRFETVTNSTSGHIDSIEAADPKEVNLKIETLECRNDTNNVTGEKDLFSSFINRSQVPLIKKSYDKGTQILNKKLKKEEPNKRGETIGLLSMIFGIASIPLLFVFLSGLLFAIAAVILGANGLRINKNPEDRVGKVFSKVGLVTGIITLSLFLLFLIIAILLILTFTGAWI